eukprot:19042-Heterococcus_DN1.PRE.1
MSSRNKDSKSMFGTQNSTNSGGDGSGSQIMAPRTQQQPTPAVTIQSPELPHTLAKHRDRNICLLSLSARCVNIAPTLIVHTFIIRFCTQPFTAEWSAAARRMQARNHLPCQYYDVVIDNSTPISCSIVRTWKPPVYVPAEDTTSSGAASGATDISAGVAAAIEATATTTTTAAAAP